MKQHGYNDRQSCTERRKDILEGDWIYHLEQHVKTKLSIQRIENMGVPSKSINLFRSVVEQLSVLYDKAPIVRNENLTPLQDAYLSSLNVFRLHSRLNKYVVGLRECFIKLDWSPGDHLSEAGIRLRLVTPDCVEAYADIDNPTVPYRIEEKRCRKIGNKTVDCLDIWDVSDLMNPYYEVRSTNMKSDYTDLLGLRFEYPYVTDDGRPYLPWVLYHASESTCLFNHHELEELVEATLDIGLDWSFWRHCLLEASWSQKYTIDLQLAGLEHRSQGENGARAEIPIAPNSLMQFTTDSNKESATGTFNVVEAAIDPKKIAESIAIHSLSICDSLGISPDIQKTQSAQSGVSIQIRRDSVREMQKKYTRQFQSGDTELLAKIALINNDNSDVKIPVKGYSVTYPSIPMSHDELTSKLDFSLKLLANGLTTKERILAELNPELDASDIMNMMSEMEQAIPTPTQGV